MQALRWTLPVIRWSVAVTGAADVGFIEPMVRRRLSSLSRAALKVAHDCMPDPADQAQGEGVRLVFASRHGELKRTTDILLALSQKEPVSPTAFSLSVLNAMTGVLGIARGERAPASALSAGEETLGLALLEAHAQLLNDPSSPVLVVYADEPVDPLYGPREEGEGERRAFHPVRQPGDAASRMFASPANRARRCAGAIRDTDRCAHALPRIEEHGALASAVRERQWRLAMELA